ncbi:MAG: segregation/condensation protein A [Clostridia bacterium]|nr:segregation/condensation protein A [Clostridia bacterium]
METLTYRLDQFQFEGPLDLLMALIQKNKVNIEDIPISLICDQYLEYLRVAQSMDMEIAGEFIVMASELMRIKSKMLLPRPQDEEKDPRAELADALMRFQQAKQAAVKMAELYKVFSGRMAKDTDEISIDTSYVADQQVTSLCLAVRRIIAANESRPKVEKTVFAPMIAKPIVPVEIKIVGILHRMSKKQCTSMEEILSDATSLPDLIAIFLGILELVKVRKILIEDGMFEDAVHGTNTVFTVNDSPAEEESEKKIPSYDPDEPIPLSSKAEMHREQRRILREQKLEEKKRLRAEERAKRAEERKRAAQDGTELLQEQMLPADDSDLEEEARIAAILEDQLSESDEDLLDDIGLDMSEIISHIAKKSKEFSANNEEGQP